MQPQILIIGAGKSATVLIQYLQQKAVENNWYIILADGDLQVAEQKWNQAKNGHAIGFDIENDELRAQYIQAADMVVSMLPAFLHIKVAKDCISFSKPLFTASYVDDHMKALAPILQEKNLLFLCEMGLDPGIDHMSAMELIHRIQNKGGVITQFKSHCGGLIAPESDTNPWHYKISWNPRNIILAGKAGAVYLENGSIHEQSYPSLFHATPLVNIPSIGPLTYYPNRDSLSYISIYDLNGVKDFVRTTLRHPDFCVGWDAIVQLGLTSETQLHLNGNETIQDWFQQHLVKENFESLYATLMQNETIRNQFNYLGFDETEPIPLVHNSSNASILQWLLEQKWKLSPTDKDMVVMLHEITYELNNVIHEVKSSLVLKGKNAVETAMATSVGLPLAMGVCAYLKGEINLTGLHIPTHPNIYKPILKALANVGIEFVETEK
jgi:saccharopine dehydrogenase (NADP+, L-glutamate forming)